MKKSFEELGKEFEDFGKEVEALFKNTKKTESSKYGFESLDRNKDGKITDADFYQTDSEDGITMKETDYSQWKNLVQNEKVPNVRSSSLKDNCGVGMQCVGFKCVHEISFKPIPGFDLGIKTDSHSPQALSFIDWLPYKSDYRRLWLVSRVVELNLFTAIIEIDNR